MVNSREWLIFGKYCIEMQNVNMEEEIGIREQKLFFCLGKYKSSGKVRGGFSLCLRFFDIFCLDIIIYF